MSQTASQHTNRLAHETSPYLLQHAHNPVDWYPWGEEAFAKARAEDKAIFLSIGYAACHWCHVMAHESFENPDIAAIMNAHFINIKVDREERPDVDEIYMNAVIGLTGSGGWPMSVFLTPDLRPFYGGTYYPPVDLYGRPGFPTVLNSVAVAWRDKRKEILDSATSLTSFVQQQLGAAAAKPGDLTPKLLDGAVDRLRRSYDSTHGGWGGAPKFPSSASILLLLRAYARSSDTNALGMAENTLDEMAFGGMYDQLGGGFHRYSVDAAWLVPHFEKMLYDNGQLAVAYLEAFQVTKKPLYKRIAAEILDYELREMRDPLGGFHSTEDADSEHEEGKFYIWARAEIMATLGAEDGALFCDYYAVREGGNFDSHEAYHKGQNILHVPVAPEDFAKKRELSVEELEARLAPMREKLFHLRAKRVRPGLDDKVLTSWNALMIAALCKGGQVLGDARYAQAAEEAGNFIRTNMMRDGALLRTHRHGESRLPAYLDDYAFTINAFIDLYETTFKLEWLEAAAALMEEMNKRFWDESASGYHFTGDEHTNLIVRTRPSYDGAEPSGNSMAALALLRLATLLDNADYRKKGDALLRGLEEQMRTVPQGYLRLLLALDFHLNTPREIALVGKRGDAALEAMLRTAMETYVPNRVLALLDPSAPEAEATALRIPLLKGKTLVDGQAAGYVCRGFQCKLPVTTPEKLAGELKM